MKCLLLYGIYVIISSLDYTIKLINKRGFVMTKLIVLTSQKNLGDNTNARGIASKYAEGKNITTEEIEIVNKDGKDIHDALVSELGQTNEEIIVVGAGAHSARAMKKIREQYPDKKVTFIFNTHQIGRDVEVMLSEDGKSGFRKGDFVFLPEYELEDTKYKELPFVQSVPTVAVSVTQDCVRSGAQKFLNNNHEKLQQFLGGEAAYKDFCDTNKARMIFFLGGSAEKKDNTLTRFTVEDAQIMAESLIAETKRKGLSDVVVFTHGLRTFTNPSEQDPKKREQDLMPYKAFKDALSASGLDVVFFDKEWTGENPYQFGLSLALNPKNSVGITVEQISGIAELLILMANPHEKLAVYTFPGVELDSHKSHAESLRREGYLSVLDIETHKIESPAKTQEQQFTPVSCLIAKAVKQATESPEPSAVSQTR
jgi:hypothetical protein